MNLRIFVILLVCICAVASHGYYGRRRYGYARRRYGSRCCSRYRYRSRYGYFSNCRRRSYYYRRRRCSYLLPVQLSSTTCRLLRSIVVLSHRSYSKYSYHTCVKYYCPPYRIVTPTAKPVTTTTTAKPVTTTTTAKPATTTTTTTAKPVTTTTTTTAKPVTTTTTTTAKPVTTTTTTTTKPVTTTTTTTTKPVTTTTTAKRTTTEPTPPPTTKRTTSTTEPTPPPTPGDSGDERIAAFLNDNDDTNDNNDVDEDLVRDIMALIRERENNDQFDDIVDDQDDDDTMHDGNKKEIDDVTKDDIMKNEKDFSAELKDMLKSHE